MTSTDVAGTCPSLDTLAAFVDAALPAPERAAVVSHLAHCARCRDMVSSVVAASREAEPAEGGGRVLRPRRPWLRLGALAAVAAAVVVGVGAWLRQPADGELDGLAGALALEETRPVSGRLSGDLPYRPEPRVVRGEDAALTASLRVAIALIDKAADERPSPAIRRAQGIARLVEGHADEAVKLLSALSRETPEDALAWSDLAAALMARAGPLDAAAALDACDRALTLRPGLAEALFNRALALERMGSTSKARAAWDAYLAVDATSAWAAEAKDHRHGGGSAR